MSAIRFWLGDKLLTFGEQVIRIGCWLCCGVEEEK